MYKAVWVRGSPYLASDWVVEKTGRGKLLAPAAQLFDPRAVLPCATEALHRVVLETSPGRIVLELRPYSNIYDHAVDNIIKLVTAT